MADHPARRGYDPASEDTGWGSPMPAEYGSLTAFLPPLDEPAAPESRPPDPRPPDRPPPERRQSGPRGWRARRAAPDEGAAPVSPNGASAGGQPAVARSADGQAAGGPPGTWPPSAGSPPRPDSAAARSRTTRTAAPVAPVAPATRDPRRAPLPPPIPVPVVPLTPPAGEQIEPDLTGATPTRETFRSRRRLRKEARPKWAQSKRTVRHLNVWTVFKVSLAFYFMVLIAVVVASVMLWYIADAFGSITSIEKSVKTLFDLSKFTVHPGEVFKYTSLGGAILAVCGTFANVLAALMYNLISDLVGGIRFDVVDEGK